MTNIEELLKRVRLTPEEIREKVRVSYNPDWDEAQLFNAAPSAVAQAATNKVIQDKDLYVVDEKELPQPTELQFYLDDTELMVSKAGMSIQETQLMVYAQSQKDMFKWHKESLIPLAEAIKNMEVKDG